MCRLQVYQYSCGHPCFQQLEWQHCPSLYIDDRTGPGPVTPAPPRPCPDLDRVLWRVVGWCTRCTVRAKRHHRPLPPPVPPHMAIVTALRPLPRSMLPPLPDLNPHNLLRKPIETVDEQDALDHPPAPRRPPNCRPGAFPGPDEIGMPVWAERDLCTRVRTERWIRGAWVEVEGTANDARAGNESDDDSEEGLPCDRALTLMTLGHATDYEPDWADEHEMQLERRRRSRKRGHSSASLSSSSRSGTPARGHGRVKAMKAAVAGEGAQTGDTRRVWVDPGQSRANEGPKRVRFTVSSPSGGDVSFHDSGLDVGSPAARNGSPSSTESEEL